MYKLVIINHASKRTGLHADDYPDDLIRIGERLLRRFPDGQYAVIDEAGAVVWPA
ncbi:hypothetical protein SAMN02745823_03526 [Sporobacter termitidis DSM 10068]|uniref:Uncharacterized protein n=1 Tax=Sporobacter termitidis DSM 10068 TaxID=1123282 RepID=A0A1M5ZCP4_9FIRM|nr:hypothetical protein [Sporobacter termitidis]SHI21968.1 hypothetical protein SAMN02745823_03526 [Sporobacter termitidis DSM 10068]